MWPTPHLVDSVAERCSIGAQQDLLERPVSSHGLRLAQVQVEREHAVSVDARVGDA